MAVRTDLRLQPDATDRLKPGVQHGSADGLEASAGCDDQVNPRVQNSDLPGLEASAGCEEPGKPSSPAQVTYADLRLQPDATDRLKPQVQNGDGGLCGLEASAGYDVRLKPRVQGGGSERPIAPSPHFLAALSLSRMTVAGYLLVVTAVVFLAFAGRTYDDPFVTLRYAQNLAQARGFVYNAGEHTLSTTAPLWAIVLAAFAYLTLTLTPDLPHVANLIDAFCLAVGALCLFDLARGVKQPIVGWVALIAYPTFSLLLNTLGSEMPFYLALCLGAFAAYARRKAEWGAICAAICAALAVLARPDGVLVGVALGVHWALSHESSLLMSRTLERENRGRQKPGFSQKPGFFTARLPERLPIAWRTVTLYVCIVGAWAVFAWLYFGSPIPLTLAAKQAQGSLPISTRFLPGLVAMQVDYLPGVWGWLMIACALAGVAVATLKERSWLPLFIWTLLFCLAYALLGVSRYFWYYAPLMPGFVVALGLSIQVAVRRAGSLVWARVIAGILVICLLAGQLIQLAALYQRIDNRMPVYRAVGEWLRQNTSPDATVGALEVGAIGYYAERRMIDFAGLLQPRVSAALSATGSYDEAAVWTFTNYRLDYLVIQENSLPSLVHAAVRASCRPVQEFSDTLNGQPNAWRIYRCPTIDAR